MGRFADDIVHIARSTLGKRDSGLGDLLGGQDPSVFDSADPIRLWIIQLGVILLMTQLLSLILRRLRQPKVIAEVIGGILLGPTAFGRIPGFTEHIFPSAATSYLTLVADIGLCLFLFLVGLEIDGSIVKRNYRLSFIIALAGMMLPFGLGACLSIPLYHHFIDTSVKFTNFMLFTGVAYSITAFPVLCRILTELKLLDTTVGVVVLSAGVGNDVVGWVLLALAVALVSAGSGLTALYVLLTCVAWVLFLLFFVRRIVHWLARKTGSIENGPTVFFMTCIILLLFGSAFFTDIIGVQPIFGAFLAGLIVPREGGLCITLTEKLEDMVSVIFLPLYFTLSGLNTNLGLLNDGITWGFTIAIISLSYSGKFGGCTLAARLAGFSWREAGTIGSLMSCKGLVELIVLNVGLNAGILSQRVFSMFVLEALVLTFCTTPAVVALYPPHMRVRVGHSAPHVSVRPGEVDEKGSQGSMHKSDYSGDSPRELSQGGDRIPERKTRFSVVLDKIEHLPGILALTQLLQPPPNEETSAQKEKRKSLLSNASLPGKKKKRPHPRGHGDEVSIDALRLIELSDRTSAVMRSSNADMLINTDSMLNIFGTFGDLNGISVSSSLRIVTYDDLPHTVAEHAEMHRSQLVLVPWLPMQYTANGTGNNAADVGGALVTTPRTAISNPFDALFGEQSNTQNQSASALHSTFVRSIFAQARTDVALYIDRHNPGDAGAPTLNCQQHIFLPFFGGPDNRLALDFLVQLCAHPRVTATVARVIRREYDDLREMSSIEKPSVAHLGDQLTVATTAFPDTVYGHQNTQTRLQSETADNLAWSRYASQSPDASLSAALSRVEFMELPTSKPLLTVIETASRVTESAHERRARPMVFVGRSRRLATENHAPELNQLTEQYGAISSEVRKTVGDVTAALLAVNCKASIVVLQAAVNTDIELC